MKVTVCELSDNESHFIDDWDQLIIHVNKNKPDLLLIPEMPFCKWIASEKKVNHESKIQSVEKHDNWVAQLEKLNVDKIVYSRPILSGNKFFNVAIVFQRGKGHLKIHSKTFFPEEPFFWEESWYDREEEKKFELIELGDIKMGVLLCTEMWFMEYARLYGKQGIDILFCPRATGMETVEKWIRCGQILSVVSGAYCLSSNKSGVGDNGFQWGGKGWIAEPVTGNLLGLTNSEEKFITVEIDLKKSKEAKNDYPLYVKE